jgi:3-methylfumaryl-CoA hydratase
MTAFRFRAVRPLFDVADFAVCGTPSPDRRRVELWAQGADGFLAMQAEAELGGETAHG